MPQPFPCDPSRGRNHRMGIFPPPASSCSQFFISTTSWERRSPASPSLSAPLLA